MSRATLVLSLALLAFPASALADIGPKPTTSGLTPRPAGFDMPGIEVEMVAEKVDLLLRAEGENEFRLEVRAVFPMLNHGEEATFETGFPIGPFLNFEAFSIQIDDREIEAKVVDRGEGRSHDYWYVWSATYPGNAVSTHVVAYVVKMYRRPVSPNYGGYVLRTGAPWKGPIGKAVVTLRVGDGVRLDQIFRAEPLEGGRREEDRLVWTFEDFEPTSDHDITFYFGDTTLEEDLAEARGEAERSWSGRGALLAHLSRLPDYWLRERMTDEELAAYLDALAALIDGWKADGDRIVLPRTDAEGDRAYVGSPENLLGFIRRASMAVADYPESARARELLGTWVAIAERFLEGNLYAGEVKLELPWRGPAETEAERAFRDQAIAKRRASIEEDLARARAILAAAGDQGVSK